MKQRTSGIPSISWLLAGLALVFLSICPALAASWSTNGSMMAARSGQTATLLPNGKVLVAGGCFSFSFGSQQSVASLASAELYDLATGTWTNTGSLNEARYGHTATLLPNGKVLVVGGISVLPHIAYNTELYDPVTGTWTTTTTEPVGRYGHTATLLPNGKVLVVGGYGTPIFGPYPLSSSELFDPSTETWTNAGTTIASHAAHTATLLPDGKVLIAGGAYMASGLLTFTITNTVELFNPADGTWVTTGSLNIARGSHTATLLPDGQVLVTGGYGINGTLDSAELYNPSNETWALRGALNAPRYDHSATLLPNGEVLVAGGIYSHSNTNDIFPAAEIYSPNDGTWRPTIPLNTPRYSHTATLLPGRNVLISGGIGTNAISFLGTLSLSSTEVYDPTINPATGTNMLTGAMITRRSLHQAMLLPNGKVLVAGGMNDASPFQSAELFSPSNGTWTAIGSMRSERDYGSTLTLLPNGNVLAAGGFDPSATYYSELYNPTNGTWTGILQPISPDVSPTATLLPNGKVLVAGGYYKGTGIITAIAELYNPGTKTWTLTGAMRTARWGHTATLLPNGKVLAAGGIANYNGSATNTAEVYDPVSGTWSNTGAMNGAHYYHTATLLPNGKVLVAGGSDRYSGSATNSAELYDPVSGTWSYTGAMNVARAAHSATLLPSGKVMFAGGVGTNSLSVSGLYDCLFSVELYEPATGTWGLTSELKIARNGHTATLLPNGKVLIAGGFNSHFSYPTDYVSNAELYDPAFDCSNSWRPRITAVTSPLNLGGSLVVTGAQFRGVSEGSSGNTQDSSADYPLVQLRSLESGQTVFLSSTNWGTNSFASLPVWNFPPGYALATVFVNGIQSTSSIVNISVPIPAMTTLNNAVILSNGQCQFCFTNNPGALFGVLATTNLSLPLTNWTRLGGVMEIAPGQFQFTDPQAMNGGQRFYNIYAP